MGKPANVKELSDFIGMQIKALGDAVEVWTAPNDAKWRYVSPGDIVGEIKDYKSVRTRTWFELKEGGWVPNSYTGATALSFIPKDEITEHLGDDMIIDFSGTGSDAWINEKTLDNLGLSTTKLIILVIAVIVLIVIVNKLIG